MMKYFHFTQNRAFFSVFFYFNEISDSICRLSDAASVVGMVQVFFFHHSQLNNLLTQQLASTGSNKVFDFT